MTDRLLEPQMEIACNATRQTTSSGRPPRYRTSCDNCQAAKIKCGHEKPSCRRCSVQELECVYSLSRRMGRPRQTQNKDGAPRQDPQSVAQASTSHVRPQSQNPINMSISQTEYRRTALSQNFPPTEQITRNAQSTSGSNPLAGAFDSSTTSIQPETAIINNIHDDLPNSQPQPNLWDLSSPLGSYFEFDDFSSIPEIPSCPNDITSDFTTGEAVIFEAPVGCPEGPDIHQSTAASIALDETSTLVDAQIDPRLRDTSAITKGIYQSTRSDEGAANEELRSSSSTDLIDSLLDVEFDPSPNTSSGTSNISHIHTETTSSSATISSLTELLARNDKTWSGCNAPAGRKKHTCNCSSIISKDIETLRAAQQKPTITLIDGALKLEGSLAETLASLERCSAGCSSDGIVTLLAAISVEILLELLQEAARHEFKKPHGKRLGGSQSGAQSRVRVYPQQSLAEPCDFHIGSYKVPPKTRLQLLRLILQARFRKLAGFIEERERILGELKPDGTTRAAALLVQDVWRGLHTIRGWIEVWER